MKNDGGPAFPTAYQERDGDTYTTNYYGGMTLRDYFAGAAMAGQLSVLSNLEAAEAIIAECKKHGINSEEYIALTSYRHADAMLKERDK